MNHHSTDLNIVPFLALGLQPWPIFVVIEDCYVPKSAQQVLEAAIDASIELIGAILSCRGLQAEQQLAERRN